MHYNTTNISSMYSFFFKLKYKMCFIHIHPIFFFCKQYDISETGCFLQSAGLSSEVTIRVLRPLVPSSRCSSAVRACAPPVCHVRVFCHSASLLFVRPVCCIFACFAVNQSPSQCCLFWWTHAGGCRCDDCVSWWLWRCWCAAAPFCPPLTLWWRDTKQMHGGNQHEIWWDRQK